MHISELHDYGNDEAEAKAEEFVTEERKAAIKSELEQLIDDEFVNLKLYAGEHISETAARRAELFLEKVLEGDDKAFAALLGNTDGDRYRRMGYDAGQPWAHLIHGSLFETGGIKLRRNIVEAFPESLRNERIKDLESIVEGLENQVRKLEADLERARELR